MHLKIVQSQSTNCKCRILKFRFKYYSSRVITPDSAWYSYPNNSQLPSFFRVAKRGQVIRRNLMCTVWDSWKGLFLNYFLMYLVQTCPTWRWRWDCQLTDVHVGHFWRMNLVHQKQATGADVITSWVWKIWPTGLKTKHIINEVGVLFCIFGYHSGWPGFNSHLSLRYLKNCLG